MRHEKIFLRPDKSKTSISVDVYISGYSGDSPKWSFSVHICQPRKRTWRGVLDHDDYFWRRLDMKEREKSDIAKQLEYVTPEEVLEVQLELWEQLKPTKL